MKNMVIWRYFMKRVMKKISVLSAITLLLTANFLSAGANACEEPQGKYQVSTNQNNSFFVKPDGTLWATGYNTLWGHLGDGTADTKKQTTPVQILDDVKFVAAGISIHSLAVKNDGTVWGWGNNASGQLGSAREIKAVLSPTQVPNLTNVKTVEAGGYFSVALKNDGTVWTLGENAGGVLGVPDSEVPKSYSPIQVETLSDISAISSGSYHTMALKSDGTVWTWGKNSTGQIGVSKDVQMTGVPVQVEGLSNVVAVSAGREFSLVLKDDGTVWGWGKNSDLFGASVAGNTYAPVQIEGLENVTYIEAGTTHSFAKKSDGTVWAWGNNSSGSLGNGMKTSTGLPIEITNLFNFESLSAGTNVSLGVKSDGTVWSWGYNDHGELGIGNTTYKTSPVQVTLK
ncbi:RCC1 repeat- and reductase domain-containing protein [Brevibacillus brevis]|uniref:RCC1 repeat-and reductase domain-containing protein n=3 Tax=Brevibacillus brevis TaxID=1393 RepID=A0A517I0X7_BREBE|nr:RCC1 repeat- and reductase domain-containing protein [Brevibacillus brevis]